MKRELAMGHGKKLEDVNWIESTKDKSSDSFWCFTIRVCLKILLHPH
jgi:hypothetical protein